MKHTSRLAVVALLTLLALLVPLVAVAAPGSSAVQAVVSGTVYCSSGSAVSGATIDVSLLDKNGIYQLLATLISDDQGAWSYAGKAGAYRFVFGVAGSPPVTRYLTMANKGVYTLDATIECFGAISGTVYNGALGLPMTVPAYISFYRQNADGSWPVPGYTYDVVTNADGSYSSGPLPLGTYKVRFFGMHTGSQFWQYAPTMDLATPLVISTPGQAYVGIDGWFNKP